MNIISEKNQDLIHKYFRDTLSDSEYLTFNALLNYPAFRTQVLIEADILEGVVMFRRDKVATSLREARLELKNKTEQFPIKAPSRWNYKLLYWLIIAGLLCLGLYFTLVKLNSVSVGDEIYAEYFLSYETSAIKRGSSNNPTEIPSKVALLYDNNQYQEALNLLLSTKPLTDQIILLQANCYMNLGKYSEALVSLKSISSTENIAQHADWYSILCLFKLGKKEAAIDLLFLVSQDKQHLYNSRSFGIINSYNFKN